MLWALLPHWPLACDRAPHVTAHGGSIAVEAVAPVGARFTIRLPASPS
jgi:signal transduction histidine kinase